MNISPKIYENLTARQRLIAVVEAIARGDEAEEAKLQRTCPRVVYKQEDFNYQGAKAALIDWAMVNELFLTSNVLNLHLATTNDEEELAERSLQRLINDQAAWSTFLGELGIDPHAIDEMVKPVRHPLVACWLEGIGGDDYPNAEKAKVDEQVQIFREAFKRFDLK